MGPVWGRYGAGMGSVWGRYGVGMGSDVSGLCFSDQRRVVDMCNLRGVDSSSVLRSGHKGTTFYPSYKGIWYLSTLNDITPAQSPKVPSQCKL
jgi:hypothetical protein